MSCNFSFGEDELGKFTAVDIDTSIYSMRVLLKTAYWFTDAFYLLITWVDKQQHLARVVFRSKDLLTPIPSTLPAEFSNCLLDYAVREVVGVETNSIKNVLVKKAFSEALSTPDRLELDKYAK